MVFVECQEAPVLRPSRRDFSRPFVDYVREQFRKHPNWACFKVVPPKGWAPKKGDTDLEELRIQTPIRQHAFGKGGAYMCILEEQRAMTAADFKKYADHHQAPPQGGRDDACMERAFWSSVTINPPLYGADTPISLFDDKLDYGWNLKDLNCLFKEYNVPKIVGVTTPMTYFGTWKSFSGWHKEDIDLNSINYMHFGAPKVWYCVSPKDADKFDEMCRSLFPDLHCRCPAFMRHKDILISPKVLRSHGIDFMQTKQNPGEFIVLNAAAYHSVFNLGFNCAEAVNFAIPEWLPVGRASVNCECEALPDGVQLDMGIFFPDLRRESVEDESDSEEEGEEEGSDSEDEGSEEEEEQQQQQRSSKRSRPSKAAAAAAAAARPRARPKAVALGEKKRASAAAAAQKQPAQPAQRGWGSKRGRGEVEGSESEEGRRENTPANKRQREAAAKPLRTPTVPQVPSSAKPANTPRGAAHSQWGPVAMDKPMALVSRDENTKALSFQLVHRLARTASKPGSVWVGLLAEGPGGTYRPSSIVKQVALGVHYPKLVNVRAEWVENEGKRQGCWKLTTTARRILM